MYVGLGFVSNYFKDKCILIEPDTISWINPWAFFPLLLSSVGIILTLEVRYILGRVDFSVLKFKKWKINPPYGVYTVRNMNCSL